MTPPAARQATPGRDSDSATDAAPLREVSSEALFGAARIVLIRHADAVYTLRRTSTGKLILTK